MGSSRWTRVTSRGRPVSLGPARTERGEPSLIYDHRDHYLVALRAVNASLRGDDDLDAEPREARYIGDRWVSQEYAHAPARERDRSFGLRLTAQSPYCGALPSSAAFAFARASTIAGSRSPLGSSVFALSSSSRQALYRPSAQAVSASFRISWGEEYGCVTTSCVSSGFRK